jgi:hypothetical protein
MATQDKPDLIDRLTLTGWVLLVILCGIFTVLVPVLLFNVYPAALQVGGRTTRYAIIATFMALGVPTFLLCKWVLEKLGIAIARPPHSET